MKYKIDYTSKFKKQYKQIKRQEKDIKKLYSILEALSNGEELDEKYKNHNLINDRLYKNCKECHIELDW